MAPKGDYGAKQECAVQRSPRRGRGSFGLVVLNRRRGDWFPRHPVESYKLRGMRKRDLMRA